MTGYYEPEVIAYEKYKKNTYPIYKINTSKYGKDIFNNSRKIINQGVLNNKGLEIAWLENEVEAFFLQIQGSGRLRYQNGKTKRVRFAGSNKKKYTSIGKVLIKKGKISEDEVSMFTLKEWLYKNEKLARTIMEKNERYIYFEEYEGKIRGSAKIELVPFISIAIDPSYYSEGDILLIKDNNKSNKVYLTIAHDTGAAIRGKKRVDLFTGHGVEAEKVAAVLNQEILIWKLKPKSK